MSDLFSAYRDACAGAAFFDLSASGKVELAGKDAAMFLQNLCTNDVKRLTPGQGCEAFFTNAKARVSAYAWIQCVGTEGGAPGYLVDVAPGLGEVLFKHLNHYLISEEVELTDRSSDLAEFHVVGPKAAAVVADVAGRVWRHDRMALPGYDVLCPAAEADAVRGVLLQAGAIPAGPDTFDILRIEAGVPAPGAEIDDTRLAMELGRTAQAISYGKGCYLGQETIVMARDRGHVNRTLLGLKLGGDNPAARGAKVFHGAEEIGKVTSSVYSPRVGAAVALAFLQRGHQQPGTVVEVEMPARRRAAEIAALPFPSIPANPVS